jgi:hypothetical protein
LLPACILASGKGSGMGPGKSRRAQELRDELQRLMLEQVESLKRQTFGGLSAEEMRKQDERLKYIREVSAELMSALKDKR